MQFTFIVVVSAHVGSLLLVGWMTVQLHRQLRRIERRLALLESSPERVPVAWPDPAAPSNRAKPASPSSGNSAPLRKPVRTRIMPRTEPHDNPPDDLFAHPNAANAEPASGRA